MNQPSPDVALADVVRDEAGLIAASLSRRIGDFDLAEEAVQDAIVAALRTWRRDGVPPNPAAWLSLTARRNAIDRLRRRASGERAAQALGSAARAEPRAAEAADPRLPMLFACCHPSLAPEARLALTLRAVVGLTTGQIARAFLVPEPTLAQRIVRAKRKIVQAGIPLRVPPAELLPERLDDVLTVTYLAYNAGYLSPHADERHDVAADAVWLGELIVGQLQDEPEALGLLALLLLLQSRTAARFGADGSLVPLGQQDRSQWDRRMIRRADALLARAAARHRPGRYQLQAALAACHAQAPTAEATDWLQILTLYDLLIRFDRSPIVLLNRAIALAEVEGAEAGLREIDGLGAALRDYHLLHATRGQLLASIGRRDEARRANRRALELAGSPAEQQLLRTRIGHTDA